MTTETKVEAVANEQPKHWGELMRELRSEAPASLVPLVDSLSFACDQRLSFLLHERYEQDLAHASAITALEGEVSRLREALKFIADMKVSRQSLNAKAKVGDRNAVAYDHQHVARAALAINLEPPTDGR